MNVLAEKLRNACWLFVLCLGLAIAGCKAQGNAGDFFAGPGTPAPAPVSPAQPAADLKIGSGNVQLVVLLPLSATGQIADKARAVREGATLAVDDLGDGILSVIFKDQSADPKSAVLTAFKDGAAAVIGPFETGPAASVASIRGGTVPPIFLMSEGVAGGPSIYNVPLQGGASAAAGARALAKLGARNFVLIASDGGSVAAIEKAVDFAAADHGGRLVAKARYSPNEVSMLKAVDTIFAVMSTPDVVVVAGEFDPVAVVTALRAKGGPGLKIVANSSWRQANLSDPKFNGVLIADVDDAELNTIAGRYRSRFGHELTPLAAYAYDVVALSSGIARSVGREGFTPVIIEDGKGFRGSTGTFRFRANGNSDRLLALYAVQAGKVKKIEAPPKVF